jgi:hypothetical protein
VTLLNICQFLGDMMNEFRHIGKNPAKLWYDLCVSIATFNYSFSMHFY